MRRALAFISILPLVASCQLVPRWMGGEPDWIAWNGVKIEGERARVVGRSDPKPGVTAAVRAAETDGEVQLSHSIITRVESETTQRYGLRSGSELGARLSSFFRVAERSWTQAALPGVEIADTHTRSAGEDAQGRKLHEAAVLLSLSRAEYQKQIEQMQEELEARFLEDPSLVSGLAQVAFRKRDYPRAQKFVEGLLRRNSNDLEARLFLAQILEKQGKLDEARVQFRVARELRPESGAAREAEEHLRRLGASGISVAAAPSSLKEGSTAPSRRSGAAGSDSRIGPAKGPLNGSEPGSANRPEPGKPPGMRSPLESRKGGAPPPSSETDDAGAALPEDSGQAEALPYLEQRFLARELIGLSRPAASLAFQRDGKVLAAAASRGRTVQIFGVASGRAIEELEGMAPVAFSRSGAILAFAGRDRKIRFKDRRSGLAWESAEPLPSRVTALIFSADDRTLFSASLDPEIRLWSVRDGALAASVETDGPVLGLAYNALKGLLADCGRGRPAKLYRTPGSSVAPWRSLPRQGPVRCLAFSLDGSRLALGVSAPDRSGKPILLRLEAEGEAVAASEGHDGAVTALVFSPPGDFLASGGEDGSIRLWRSPDGSPLFSLRAHEGTVRALALSPDGKLLASSGAEGSVRLWKVDAAREAFAELPEIEGGIEEKSDPPPAGPPHRGASRGKSEAHPGR